MVNGSQTVTAVNGGLPLFTRDTAPVALSAEAAGVAPASIQPNEPPASVVDHNRYNRFEFSYRQDFGKIVLLRQRPDTGEVVQQFPSEYFLRKYADSERVARSAEGDAGVKVAHQADAPATTSGAKKSSAAIASTPSAGGIVAEPRELAPSIPTAPDLPSGGTSVEADSAPARVDLTI